MKTLFRILFFTIVSLSAFAQSPSLRIIRVNAGNYCLGNELSIDVDVTGTFPADNKFTVVAYRNSNNSPSSWEYPAELRGDKLITVLKEPSLAGTEAFYVKVKSSNPNLETQYNQYIRALTNSTLRLTTQWGFNADTINSTDKISLSLVATPPSPGKAIISSGDTVSLSYSTGSWSGNVTSFSLPQTKAGTYYIKEASNICGPMQVSGEVRVKVTTMDILPISVSPKAPCEGAEIKVNFNTKGGEFNGNTKFKIRFSSNNGYMGSYRYMDTPAILSGKNELTTRLPDNLISKIGNQDIFLGIVTENPDAVSNNNSVKLYVYDKPSFSLKAEKYSVDLGESYYISAQPSGMYPFKVTLTNGDVLQNSKIYTANQTTQYQVKTFESGCGVIENPVNSPITVRIKPSLFVPSSIYSDKMDVYCEGQTVQLPFLASGVNNQTSYSLRINTYSGKRIDIPARVVGDKIEFVVPENNNQDPDLDFGRTSGMQIVSSNPSLTSPYFHIKFQGKPHITLDPNSVQSVPTPSAMRVSYNIWGGAPFELETKEGTKLSADSYYYSDQQFVTQNTVFQFAKISNACFSNSNLPGFSIKVDDPNSSKPSLFARVNKTNYCMGDSVEVEVFVYGPFETGNELTLSNTNFDIVRIALPSNFSGRKIFKIKLPERTEKYDQNIQLISTLPRLVSETQRIYFTPPARTPYVSPLGTKEQPVKIFVSSKPHIGISTGIPYNPLVYTVDGIENKVTTDYNGSYAAILPLENNSLTEFKIHSVSHVCGNWNGDITSYLQGIGYKLVLNRSIYPTTNCPGTPAEVQFLAENGVPKPDTKFTVQISPTGTANTYTDLITTIEGPMARFTTPDLPAGSYYIRLYSSDNIYSDPTHFSIGQAPTAKLTTRYPNYGDSLITVNYGEQAYLTATLTGHAPFGIVYSNGNQNTVTDQFDAFYPLITQSQTFSITKIWNSCGYGTVSGFVKVTSKPILELSKYPLNTDPTLCPGQKIELDYSIKGATLSAKDYIVFSIKGYNTAAIKLDSVNQTNGRIQLTIPANLTGSYFSIIAKSTSLQTEKSIAFQIYETPDLTLNGNNTITEGESSILFVRANSKFASNASFELSDGKTFTNIASYPGGITEVVVQPTTTTTYTIKPSQTTCGTSKVSGSATVTVMPKLAQSLRIEQVEGAKRYNICSGDTIRIRFYKLGSETISAGYEVQLSDSTGNNFGLIPSYGSYSEMFAVLPKGIKQSGFYRLRLISKDPKVSGSTYAKKLHIGEPARARVVTPSVYYQPGQSIEAVIALEGSNSFSYRFGDANFSQSRYTSKNSDTIRFTPTSPSATYKILQVSNECGIGAVNDPNSFTIELITGIEPLTEQIRFGPNPTNNMLFVSFENRDERLLEIIDMAGRTLLTQKQREPDATLDLSRFPPGVYLLKVRKKQAEITYRIVKY